ncbi:caspase family protein [Cupriavidus sp. AcVe19-6a]|uniref:caspase family protein n=1 Tax=Cupriavidus sp. AcVe19-6a TaxID=2821358 RepID=UPI001AE6FC1E|nr:caspase family protein [Cupriavidus sp. AcVe19-6a]MBP0639445.1 caspase family protein [Cupriavidus sp. AcVe19-6a]
MRRAVLAIGVDRSGNLPVLYDAAQGAQRFAQWAREQGINGSQLTVLTDENRGSVTIDAIKKAINRMVDNDQRSDQLLIYFAGHGVNIAYGEYWLLTDAPRDSQAAVNVTGSESLARYCGIPHVVFISDACRTAAEGLNAQRVTGSEIFPNENVTDLESPIDQFYACSLGRPALEVRDPNTSARNFSALYTGALLHALGGFVPELIQHTSEDGHEMNRIHPRPLKHWLAQQVPARIAELRPDGTAMQMPDARITSDPHIWIATFDPGTLPTPPSPVSWSIPLREFERVHRGRVISAGAMNSPIMAALIHRSVRLPASQGLDRSLTFEDGSRSIEAKELLRAIEDVAAPFSGHLDRSCGFEIRGDTFVEAVSSSAAVDLPGTPGPVLHVNPAWPGANILLVFESGRGALLPAFPGFAAKLTVVDGELVDAAYEPMAPARPSMASARQLAIVRRLRGVASVATRHGVFALEADDMDPWAQGMLIADMPDPALALYTSYAFAEGGRVDLSRSISQAMRDRLGYRFFDMALHNGELDGKRADQATGLLGCVPLLARGWGLLNAHRVLLPAPLSELRYQLCPSPWTLLDRDGVMQVRSAFQQGVLR